MSVSFVSERAKTASENLFILTKINKTFKWNFLTTIWHNNHQDTSRLCLSKKIKHLMHLDSKHGREATKITQRIRFCSINNDGVRPQLRLPGVESINDL